MPSLRTLLILGRASNLPTLWSNCLAAWMLSHLRFVDGRIIPEFGNGWTFAALCFGASLLYTGGMFLNDAFDEDFDRMHRRERPIPSGKITATFVWLAGFGLIAAGFAFMAWPGLTTAMLTLLLVGSILLYDWLHKMIAFSPVLMASCRFFLFLAVASAGERGVTGWSLWPAVALACYIIGLSYLAKRESFPRAIQFWPLLFLAVPFVLAWLVNDGGYRRAAIGFGLLLGVWVARSLVFTFRREHRNIGMTVSGLLAGIVLTDLLAVGCIVSWPVVVVFVALFVIALIFQRYVPAT
jgi:4-hydroxybenzoate polyprenyltransferase